MDNFSCIIIEDEPLARERIKNYISKIPYLELLATFDNAINGLNFLKNNKVDILFLDINMDELSGIELLESTKIESQVIITTAYQEYALKGYDLQITDYLLKPFVFTRFVQAVTKAQDQIAKQAQTILPKREYIFVKTENRLEKISFSEIVFIEGMRDYRRIHTLTRKIMTLQTFSELEQLIPQNIICRVHKSFMVSVDKIESVERSRIKVATQLIPISETYREAFFKMINNDI